ncbi:MAG: hypothetical protein H2042_04610 [Rhizobiales bacterium]|nr:hypothetical protein [Hyphomicrobiales bacterium]
MVTFAYDRFHAANARFAGRGREARPGSVSRLPQTEAHWSAPLPSTVRDDTGTRILTLKCAARFLREAARERQLDGARHAVADALVRAARTGCADDVADAALRLERYLMLERGG